MQAGRDNSHCLKTLGISSQTWISNKIMFEAKGNIPSNKTNNKDAMKIQGSI